MKVKELAYHRTHLGELTLRVRNEPLMGDTEVFEVKLGVDYLMSSLFTESEKQLATRGLAELEGELDVVVGGLGLGYTAASALSNPKVRSLLVIDLFSEVIGWHQNGLVPLGAGIAADDRCVLRQGDFFELADTGFDTAEPERTFDAVLLDIDHSPEHWLDEKNQSFYGTAGLARMARQIKPNGVFALWSNDPADDAFTSHLRTVFGRADSFDVEFDNPYNGATSVNSVYVARKINAFG